MMVWDAVLARAQHALRREQADDGSSARPDLADAEDHLHQPGWPRVRGMLLVGATLLVALAVDWLLVPWSYPVAAAYGVALLTAAHVLSPRGVAVTTGLALVLSVISNNLQGAPAAAWLADNTALVGLGLLAVLLAREREVTQAARGRIEQAYEAARVLAEATTLEEAGSALLASIGRHLAWTCGALWFLDESSQALLCVATWHRPDQDLSAFEREMRQTRIEPGVGLPGRVWATGQPLWLPDLQREANFPRRAASVEMGLRTGFGFPIRRASEILGIIEFFDARVRQPDPALLSLMDALGAQIGLFLARRQAENQVAGLLERERRARSAADAALRLRDEFLASASHDLRGPLTAILGYAALVRRGLDAGDRTRVQTALASIQAAVKRLTGGLDELVDLAQLQAGQQLALRREPTDLIALVRRVAADHEVAAEHSSIQVLSQTSELIGSWDAGRLERALGNLVGNAVKYSPPGAEVRVVISEQADPRGAWAVVEVQDRGVGIPAEDLPHIFERFHRAANVSGRLPGTGLGLPGAREVVEEHGGEIWATSEEGRGSTFTVRLPVEVEERGPRRDQSSGGRSAC